MWPPFFLGVSQVGEIELQPIIAEYFEVSLFLVGVVAGIVWAGLLAEAAQ